MRVVRVSPNGREFVVEGDERKVGTSVLYCMTDNLGMPRGAANRVANQAVKALKQGQPFESGGYRWTVEEG